MLLHVAGLEFLYMVAHPEAHTVRTGLHAQIS